jgi:hypothetical protein
MVGVLTIRDGSSMAAPSLVFPPSDASGSRDFAAEAALMRVRSAAMVARNRLAEIPGVRVIGPEVSNDAGADSVRLAMDLRDTGRDAWDVACAMAARGFPLDAASNRVIIVRLREEDLLEGIHERVAPALLMALWSTPATGAETEPELPFPSIS